MFQLSKLNLYTSFGTFVLVWMISRGGLGFLFVPINVMAFSFVPKEKMNNATGMINLARNIGGSVGISLVTTLQARLAQRHQANLIENLSPINPRYRGRVLDSGSGVPRNDTADFIMKKAPPHQPVSITH